MPDPGLLISGSSKRRGSITITIVTIITAHAVNVISPAGSRAHGGAVEGAPQPKLRWDKLSPEMLYNRYQTPLEQSLRVLISKWETIDHCKGGIDTMMREIIDTIKFHERAIPKSRFRKNIKSYWCQELNTLKQLKVQAFRAWVADGRPRDPNNYRFIANQLRRILERDSNK